MITELQKRGWWVYEHVGIEGDDLIIKFEHDIYCCNAVLRVEAADWDKPIFTTVILYDDYGTEIGEWNNLDINWDEFERACELADSSETEDED